MFDCDCGAGVCSGEGSTVSSSHWDQVARGCHLWNRAQTRVSDHLRAGTGPGRRGWNPGPALGPGHRDAWGQTGAGVQFWDWDRASAGVELGSDLCPDQMCTPPASRTTVGGWNSTCAVLHALSLA